MGALEKRKIDDVCPGPITLVEITLYCDQKCIMTRDQVVRTLDLSPAYLASRVGIRIGRAERRETTSALQGPHRPRVTG